MSGLIVSLPDTATKISKAEAGYVVTRRPPPVAGWTGPYLCQACAAWTGPQGPDGCQVVGLGVGAERDPVIYADGCCDKWTDVDVFMAEHSDRPYDVEEWARALPTPEEEV